MQSAVPSASDDLSVKNTTHSNTPRWLHNPNLPWILAYVLVASFTGAFFMADTVDYVTSAYLHEFGTDWVFWDFRHLLWRPLGWLFFHVLRPWIASGTEADARKDITIIFLIVNWICGLASLLLMRALLRRFSSRGLAVLIATLAFLFSLAFLNYIHSGCPYIPGLTFLLLGLYFIVRSAETPYSAVAPFQAALALALSVCLWFPYAFAVPGALLLPFFYSRFQHHRWRFVIKTTVICLFLGIAAYGAVLAHLRIHTIQGASEWIQSETKDVTRVAGSARAVFGLARSFLDMGTDAILFKRFLIHDPYNPVTLAQLFRVSFLKLALFYCFLASILVQLVRSQPGRNILAFCLLSAAPVAIFGLFWRGGDMERYLPLYPAFFVAVAFALADKTSPRHLKWIAAVFVITCMISNVMVTSRFTLANQRKLIATRLQDLLPIICPNSRIVVLDIHDEVVNFARTFPLDPINREHRHVFYAAINSGTAQTCHWQEAFATTVFAVWKSGGDIWISKRLLEQTPHRDWLWAEGADPCVTWASVSRFFSQFDLGSSVGARDGFALLLPTEKNRATLNPLLSRASQNISMKRLEGKFSAVREGIWGRFSGRSFSPAMPERVRPTSSEQLASLFGHPDVWLDQCEQFVFQERSARQQT